MMSSLAPTHPLHRAAVTRSKDAFFSIYEVNEKMKRRAEGKEMKIASLERELS